jgi:Domain of unknown function (DUF5069)
MTSLDLRRAPPRGPRVRLNGLSMMARTVDKLRATLPGGNLGAYQIQDMSAWLLAELDISEAALRDVVATAPDDSYVAAWLNERTDSSRYRRINEALAARVTDGTSYPAASRAGMKLLFDVLEYDDRESFGTEHSDP